jgi:hypothetical protein
LIRTVRDRLGVRSNLWLDIEFMAQLVDDYNNTQHSAFYHIFTPFQVHKVPNQKNRNEEIALMLFCIYF